MAFQENFFHFSQLIQKIMNKTSLIVLSCLTKVPEENMEQKHRKH